MVDVRECLGFWLLRFFWAQVVIRPYVVLTLKKLERDMWNLLFPAASVITIWTTMESELNNK